MARPQDVGKAVLSQLLSLGGKCEKSVWNIFYNCPNRKYWVLQYAVNDEYVLQDILKNLREDFYLPGNSIDDVVSPTTNLSVCKQHCKRSGSCPDFGCGDLHLCVYHLLSGSCRFGDRCLFGHDVRTPHNRHLLEIHNLKKLNLTQLRTLFCLPRVRREVLAPKVCKFFGSKVGCKKNNCPALHICWFYYHLDGDRCKYGRNCNKGHDLRNPQVARILSLYGLNTARPVSELLDELRSVPKDNAESSGSGSSCDSNVEFSDDEGSHAGPTYERPRSSDRIRSTMLYPTENNNRRSPNRYQEIERPQTGDMIRSAMLYRTENNNRRSPNRYQEIERPQTGDMIRSAMPYHTENNNRRSPNRYQEIERPQTGISPVHVLPPHLTRPAATAGITRVKEVAGAAPPLHGNVSPQARHDTHPKQPVPPRGAPVWGTGVDLSSSSR